MRHAAPLFLLAWLLVAAPALAGGPALTPQQPVRSLRTAAFPLMGLGLWAQGTGFLLAPRQALYDLEGGAALRIDEGLHLTAGLRMLGLDRHYDPALESMHVEPEIGAPFLGIALEF